MFRHYVLALLLPFIIYARVLPVYDPDSRIDDKNAGSVNNQQFLSAFLGNVQTGSDSSIKPIAGEIKAPGNFDSGSTKGNEKPAKEEDGYDEEYYDGYGNDIYDDGYYDEVSNGYAVQHGYQDADAYDSDTEAQYYKASINCREFHYPHATTPEQCRDVKVRDYEPDYNRDDPNKKAFCRWDMGFSDDKDKHEGCLCPRTKYKCHKKHQCYWYKPKHSAQKYEDDGDDHGQCLHNSERFYNILANLLSKRGKKDFALKIKYSSAAAKGHLPYGPSGPGYFPYDQHLYKHSNYGNERENGYESEHDVGYDSPHEYGRQNGYGNDYYNIMGGYGGYNHMVGYGAHNHRGYGVHNHIGGYDAHNHGGHGVHNQISGYGAHNQIGGYGAFNHIGVHGDYNHIGGYGGYPNVNQPQANSLYSAPNDQYSAGYNVNQGYDNYGTTYGNEGYVNSQPIYNAYNSENPTQSPVPPFDVDVPYAHTPSNYIENMAYPPSREANSLSNQNVSPLPPPEYHAVPPSEQPIYGSPPGISSAPYLGAPNLNQGYPVQTYSLTSTPVNPVNAAQHQAVVPPVSAAQYQAVPPPVSAAQYQAVAPPVSVAQYQAVAPPVNAAQYQAMAPPVNSAQYQAVVPPVNAPIH